MIHKPSADELLKKAVNSYELVITISKRARQLHAGAISKINIE